MKILMHLFFILLVANISANENWESYWHEGVKFHTNQQYEEASSQFEHALGMMSDEEQNLFPFVNTAKAESDFVLQNYSMVLKDTKKAIKSKNLTDYERLICGSRRVAAYVKLGDENAALKEYNKYIAKSPIMPKTHYTENQIIIRNILDCDLYKDATRQLMLSRHCKSENDIHEYGNMWVIDITKVNDLEVDKEIISQNYQKLFSVFKHNARVNSSAQFEGCCNTCDKLALGANILCACLIPAEFAAGPIVAVACTSFCLYFVEQLKQDCKSMCAKDPKKPGEFFKEWKDQFKYKHQDCPHPRHNCP